MGPTINLASQWPAYDRFWISQSPHAAGLFKDETQRRAQFASLAADQRNSYERHYFVPGHFTGSALVVSPDLSQVLLTLHAKLGMWLQLGGHADGDMNLLSVAAREVYEEAGLNTAKPLAFLPNQPDFYLFDVDCHLVPAIGKEPAHHHFDARFLFVADPNERLQITEESKDLRWFDLPQARQVTSELSMLRLFDKLNFLRDQS